MPELPEVETTARGLRASVLGARVAAVREADWPRMLPNASADQIEAAVRGRPVVVVERRGKYLLLGFEGDVWLAVHRKMSGNLLLRAPDAPPEPHTHLELAFEDGRRLRFVDARKFGRVYLFGSSAEAEAFLDERLGPEPLAGFDARSLAARLRGRRGRIKSLLLDQRFLAGVGNLYADEALWEAGIHPLRAADSLRPVEVSRLAAAIQRVLLLGIERRGTSFSTYRDAAGAAGENQDHLQVYGRRSEPCPRCGTPIGRLSLGQRGSHFCPRCQRAPRAARRQAGGRG